MSYLRTFVLLKDENNGAGGGKIAGIGAVMPSGTVVLEWANGAGGVAVFQSVDALLATQNGHSRSAIRWGIWDDDE